MNPDNVENNQSLLQLSPWDFDQSPNGWRKFSAPNERLHAANLIREYIAKNRYKITNPNKDEKTVSVELMYFHVGQLLALEGQEHWAESIKAFDQSFQKDRECWNAYVSATVGFLENDTKKVEDALNTIESSQEIDKRSGNLSIIKNFKKALQIGERDYEKVYSWSRN